MESLPAEHESDASLVRRAQANDRSAFDSLYAQHAGRVYAVCLRMCANRDQAEQLTQDVFVRAWQNLKSFRGSSAFGSWLYRLTVNVVLQEGRSSRRRDARVVTMAEPELFERAANGAASDDRLDLERAIATLPKGARQVLVLHDIEGYKHEEIARMTGTTAGAVKSQLHRARKLLRERL